MSEAESVPPQRAPLFLLSFRQRNELATTVAAAGWRSVAARRADEAERRFAASGAAVALVDARGALAEGLAATQALGEVVAERGAALLVLVSRGDAGRIGDFYSAGATHFLSSPMRAVELVQALRFAERHVERLGGWEARAGANAEPLGWRWDPQLRSLQITPALAQLAELPEQPGRRGFLRQLPRRERKLVHSALRRLGADTPATAFAHDLPGVGRLVHHLQYDARTRRVHALVEPLGAAPDAGAAVRDAFEGVRDATAARRWLDQRIGETQTLTAILIALERFEDVNAAHGRSAGDALLRAVARRIDEAVRSTVGKNALVARLGGPEFLVATAPESGTLLRSCIETAFTRPFVAGGAVTPLEPRIACIESEPDDSAATLLRRLTETIAERAAGPEAPALDRLAGDIARAIADGEVAIVFQPQVAIATDAIAGAEALARWQHPELGAIDPETLFAAAERAELGRALSEHVQQRALAEAADWPVSLASLRLSINVTASDVSRPDFADRLLGRIDASGFPRGRMTIEVTESSIMEELGEAARLLAELRTAGCRVAIDDFGTGYSSLAYLKALPLDVLKIDKKLSQDIAGSPRDRVVVRGVIDMARSLGLTVVAEGVETEQQLELLAKEGCQYYQGYLCAEPLDAAALARLVEERG